MIPLRDVRFDLVSFLARVRSSSDLEALVTVSNWLSGRPEFWIRLQLTVRKNQKQGREQEAMRTTIMISVFFCEKQEITHLLHVRQPSNNSWIIFYEKLRNQAV